MSTPVKKDIMRETRDKVNDVLWESFPKYCRSIRRHFLGFPFMPVTPAWKRFVINQELGPRIRMGRERHVVMGVQPRQWRLGRRGDA